MKYKKLSVALGFAALSISCAVKKQQHVQSGVHPADSLATKQTVRLYQNMAETVRRGVMFGQQDATLYGIGWKYDKNRSDVKSVCGDQPAVYGWEIGHIELGAQSSLDSVHFSIMRKRITEAYKRGGINTISWHCDNPLTGGNAWDVSQNGVVASVLPGGAKHELFMTWLDRVGDFLNSLESHGKKIPVLFRPFHEHTAGWFWWGENHCSPEEYKAMYRMMADHFRQRGIHNLIYIYSPDQTDQSSKYFERYPGDNYIDALGVDYYQQQGAAGAGGYMRTINSIFTMLTVEAKNRNKLLVFSETGSESVPMNNWWTDVLLPTVSAFPISYVMVWRNAYDRPNHFFGTYPGNPSSNNFIQFYQQSNTLFQQDISNMYK
ncbi:glycoside hydrolase family 26 protein [Mucilaginibacter pedocola]|uniref:Mannan endo-1,4-beta-mannosidase n=1 Tax=Mucilaginibacter pedocola TaxID=1792845 RepID=A0A1S9P866_9SPHI|nr:glycosyl hydrolase [Mucilaginibacter pedocola]OOQ57132.1 hypothetical protein BC343_16565 [Mucilaginibacter pedocola]